jgi:hypothetical protein
MLVVVDYNAKLALNEAIQVTPVHLIHIEHPLQYSNNITTAHVCAVALLKSCHDQKVHSQVRCDGKWKAGSHSFIT